MKNSNSISKALVKKTFEVAVKVTVFIFIFLVIILFGFQTYQKSQLIEQKIEIDKQLLVDSLKIGDLFFITKYISSLVDSEITPFAGIKVKSDPNWLILSSENRTSNSDELFKYNLTFLYFEIPFLKELNGDEVETWYLGYVLRISHQIILISLLLSILICLFVFFFLRKTLSSTSSFFTEPITNIVKDIYTQKEQKLLNIPTKHYELGQRFYETDLLINELKLLFDEISRQQKEIKDIEVFKALNKLSRQVSHDIQSPLGALKAAITNLNKNPEAASKLINMATTRISSIISDLEVNNVEEIQDTKIETDMNKFLANLIEEKKQEYESQNKPNIIIDFVSYEENITYLINQNRMARAISNILNNGIEAVEGKVAQIKVRLKKNRDRIDIEIEDNGSGINQDRVSKIFEYGISYGKPDGLGTGLSFAKEVIEDHRGNIAIKETSAKGVIFKIEF